MLQKIYKTFFYVIYMEKYQLNMLEKKYKIKIILNMKLFLKNLSICLLVDDNNL